MKEISNNKLPEDWDTKPMGYKNDVKDGKIRWELVPLDLIEWVAKVYTFGAKKYKPYSWQLIGKSEDGTNEFQRYKAALLRHLVAHEKGEFLDPESNLPHLAHVLWNSIAMLHFGLKEHNDSMRSEAIKSFEEELRERNKKRY